MTDTEVEQTLREIRERVRAEAQARALARPAHGGGGGALSAAEPPADARARLQANLATLERTYDKLPPVTSYRSGFAARVELWVKRQLRRATRWFTWEQVNFNAAVLASLRDTLDALASYEQSLLRLRAETEARLDARLDALRAALEEGSAPIFGELRAEVERTRDEGRERAAHLAEEQRVSFKQLSLEAAEQAVAFDRARRALETRLSEIEKTVNRES